MNKENERPLGIESAGGADREGRSKKRPISDRYAELLELPVPEKERRKHGLPEGATYGDALAVATFNRALEGQPDAIREIRESIEGKSSQRKEPKDDGEIRVSIVHIGRGVNPVDGSFDGSASGEIEGWREST
jgi:hypothetical protein